MTRATRMKATMMKAGIAGVAALMVFGGTALAVTYNNENVLLTGTSRLGVGTATPAQAVHMFRGDTGSVRFRMENTAGAVDLGTSSANLDFIMGATQRMRLMATGNLGLGTTNPQQQFHLNRADTGSTRFRLQNTEGSSDFSTDGGSTQFWTNAAIRMTITSLGRVGIGTQAPSQALEVNGTARVSILEIAGGADLAEQFDVASSADVHAEPGMVVSIDPARAGELVVSSTAYDRTVAGIISGAGGLSTGMMMGQQGTVADGEHPVALTGRVYCYVDGSYGAIQPGDLLTTSATPGHAMKVTDHVVAQGAIIGKAMTALGESEKGLVLVLVSLQ